MRQMRLIHCLLPSMIGLIWMISSAPASAQELPAGVPDHFYPFGDGVGDLEEEQNDDGSTGEIPIDVSFPYFNNQHTILYVDTNGVVSFGDSVWEYTPEAFSDFDKQIIAIYWADVDTRDHPGVVYYRQTQDQSLLDRATNDVRSTFRRQRDFTATWAFVATWYGVTYFQSYEEPDKTNTFQGVFVTDERHSFAIFNYGDINWTTGSASGGTGGIGGVPAEVGFSAGDGLHFHSIPASLTDDIINVETTSNVGIPGRWIFQIDHSNIDPSARCDRKHGVCVDPSTCPCNKGKYKQFQCDPIHPNYRCCVPKRNRVDDLTTWDPYGDQGAERCERKNGLCVEPSTCLCDQGKYKSFQCDNAHPSYQCCVPKRKVVDVSNWSPCVDSGPERCLALAGQCVDPGTCDCDKGNYKKFKCDAANPTFQCCVPKRRTDLITWQPCSPSPR